MVDLLEIEYFAKILEVEARLPKSANVLRDFMQELALARAVVEAFRKARIFNTGAIDGDDLGALRTALEAYDKVRGQAKSEQGGDDARST